MYITHLLCHSSYASTLSLDSYNMLAFQVAVPHQSILFEEQLLNNVLWLYVHIQNKEKKQIKPVSRITCILFVKPSLLPTTRNPAPTALEYRLRLARFLTALQAEFGLKITTPLLYSLR